MVAHPCECIQSLELSFCLGGEPHQFGGQFCDVAKVVMIHRKDLDKFCNKFKMKN